MMRFLVNRLLLAFLTIFMISLVSFLIIQLPPGDYVTSYVARLRDSGDQALIAQAESMRVLYGLDKPVLVQYFRWISQFIRGDFGISMLYDQPVTQVIGTRLGMTVIVTLGAIFVTWLLALPIGIYSAVKQYSPGDYLATFIGFLGLAVPDFLFALVIMYLAFKWFDKNVGGLFSSVEMYLAPWNWNKVADLLSHLWLPALILGLSGTARLIRIMRNNLLDEIGKPYVITARAKGLPEWKVIIKYAVRVALNPFVSTIGYILPDIVSGSIIVAIVLGLPTVGPTLYSALISQDMFLAGAIIMLIGVMTVIGTLLSDLLLVLVDPRIRMEEGRN